MLGVADAPSFLATAEVLSMLHRDPDAARRLLRRFIADDGGGELFPAG